MNLARGSVVGAPTSGRWGDADAPSRMTGNKKTAEAVFLLGGLLVRVIALGVTGVQLAWPADLVRLADHLVPVCEPARRAAGGEDHGEHLGGNTDRLEDDTGVEVDVRVQDRKSDV